jgi:DNA-binding CsgD family transcriptional regulator
MPSIWDLPTISRHHAPVPAQAVSALLDLVSMPASADRLLQAVRSVVPVDYLSWVQIRRDQPELVEGSASRPQERAVVANCFRIYRRHYYRRDTILPLARQLGSRSAREVREGVALHCRADELPDAGWRTDIYERERLTDRFTLLHAPAPDQVQAIHLYRDERQGRFLPHEVQQLLCLAPLLRQAHAASWRNSAERDDRAARVRDGEQRLQRLVPALSPRERAVCARIAQGLSADGIAADLDVAPSTVVTWRKRAYLKLAEAGQPAQRLGLARLLA